VRLSRDKVNRLAHSVADALATLDDVEFIEDPNSIRMEARRIPFAAIGFGRVACFRRLQ